MIAFQSGEESGKSKRKRKRKDAVKIPGWILQEVIDRMKECISQKVWPECASQVAPLISKACFELHEGRVWLIDRRDPKLIHNYFYKRKGK